jgi:hypothetical protein
MPPLSMCRSTIRPRRSVRSTKFIPILKGAPGFVGAYFVAVDDTHGVSMQVFETEEQAKAAAPPETGPGMGGVKLDTVQFGEVIGAA